MYTYTRLRHKRVVLSCDHTCCIARPVWIPLVLQIRPLSGGGTRCHICQAVLMDPLAVSTHYRIAHAHPPPLPPPWRPKTSTPATFECARCDHKYTSKHGMQYHMAKWHGIGELPTFQCDVCGRIFHQKCDLKRHTKQVHKL